ncbi:TRM11 family SAM-dependent methyltransferase, partial [Amycolatopsis anabasis]|uniref:TRM11 family SAM-dependent methyltransferase n=1 Tax=Amycolatopsis anabasis TaxID=1840409 RepID=UPI00131B9F42
ATVHGIGRARGDLRRLANAMAALPVHEVLAARSRCVGAGALRGVDVSASFLGRRNYTRLNYTRFDLEDIVGESVGAVLGLPYRSRRGGNVPPPGGLSWRVTVADDRALVALRLGERPLHRRPYRRASRPGSLHPPLAAALVRIVRPPRGTVLLDPCCGTGTIPIEATRIDAGLRVVGGDVNPRAVAQAATNDSDTAVRWVVADAGRLPLPAGTVDLVVANPPWNRQVPFAGTLARQPTRFWSELRRVLRPGGRAVLLTTDAESHLTAAKRARFTTLDKRPISLSGAHPEILHLQLR